MTKRPTPQSAADYAKGDFGSAPTYITWANDAEKTAVLKQYNKTLEEYGGFSIAGAYDYRSNDFSNILPGINSRPGLTRDRYNSFRPDEAIGDKGHQHIIRRCNTVYKEVGIIRNIMDLMADFASKGVRLVHKDKRTEKLYRKWFKIVRGEERSERIASTAIRTANVVIRRHTAKVSPSTVDKMERGYGADIENPSTMDFRPERREIPWHYTILDAGIVNVVGGSLASFVGKKMYSISLPTELRRKIQAPKNEAEKLLVAQLPADISNAANTSGEYILPPEKTIVLHYKKDDWESWATPIIYSIFKDAVAYEKMKLADIAALDGAISHIRIIKLGDIENKILPSPQAAALMASILQAHPGGGTLDIVWDAAISIEESKSEVYKFLGKEKYEPILNAIYGGLGIPPTLTGTNGATGTTNNFISLNTLIERLEYIRSMLVEFWSKEIEIFHKAMDLRGEPASIEFDLMHLGNEESMKKLYLELADRNIISQETLQQIFSQNPAMEQARLNRETKERVSGRRVRQNGPYVEAEATESLRKIALQGGIAAPSEVGLELQERKEGEKNLMDIKIEQLKMAGDQKIAQQKQTKGTPGQGRPSGTKDSTKRKTKTFTPRSKASIELWASKAQVSINEMLTPQILAFFNKKNLRQLTAEEVEYAEKIKFGVLSHIEPFSKIDEKVVHSALKDGPIDSEMWYIYSEHLQHIKADINNPSVDDLRKLQVFAYKEFYINE